MNEKYQTCPNCEVEHNTDFKFCPNCGQKSDDDITIGNLFYNTISNYFSFDARFFKSFIPLMFKPGYLAREFVRGKRLRYLHPAQMYLFVSVLFFFLFSFIQREQVDEINKALKEENAFKTEQVLDSLEIEEAGVTTLDSVTEIFKKNPKKFGMSEAEVEELDSIIKNKTNENTGNMNIFGFNIVEREVDSLIEIGATNETILRQMGLEDDAGFFSRKLAAQLLKMYKNRDGGSLYTTFYQAIPIAMFFLLPIFALLTWLFYIGKGGFAHHLVFSFYFFSFQFAFFAILTGINLIWDIPDGLDFFLLFFCFVYFIIALRRFYGQGWFLTFIKGSFHTFLFFSFVLPLAFSFLVLFSFLFY